MAGANMARQKAYRHLLGRGLLHRPPRGENPQAERARPQPPRRLHPGRLASAARPGAAFGRCACRAHFR